MSHASTYLWFLQALNVTNAALDLHRRSLRLRPLLSRARGQLEGQDLTVAIIDDERPGRPADYVTIRLQREQFVLVSHTRATPHIDWHVSRSYLVEVARHPRKFLDDPHRLDFAWLEQRVGLASSQEPTATAEISVAVCDD